MFNDYLFDLEEELMWYQRGLCGLCGLCTMIRWLREIHTFLPYRFHRDADTCLREIWKCACAIRPQDDPATLSTLEQAREAWRRAWRRDPFFGDMTLGDWDSEQLEAACDKDDDAAVEEAVREIVLEQARDAWRAWLRGAKPATERLWAKLNEPQGDTWPVSGTVEDTVFRLEESGALYAFTEEAIAKITAIEEAEVEKTVTAIMAILTGAKAAVADEIAKGLNQQE